MKRLIFAVLVLSLTSNAVAQNQIGEGIQQGAAAPGKIVEGTGTGVQKAGAAIQPNTGNQVVDTVGAVPGKVVEGTGAVVGTTGKGLQAVTNAVTGAPVDKQARADLARPVDCKTAKTDVAALEAERRSTTSKIGNGVKSVLPVSAAIRLLSGTYRDGVQVASGRYNQDLDAKIAKIKTTCKTS